MTHTDISDRYFYIVAVSDAFCYLLILLGNVFVPPKRLKLKILWTANMPLLGFVGYFLFCFLEC